MLASLKKWSPQKVFLVHGDAPTMPIFAKKIKQELGIDAQILDLGKKIEFG